MVSPFDFTFSKGSAAPALDSKFALAFAHWLIGQTIAHFKVTSKLGAGGMGEVYRATRLILRLTTSVVSSAH